MTLNEIDVAMNEGLRMQREANPLIDDGHESKFPWIRERPDGSPELNEDWKPG